MKRLLLLALTAGLLSPLAAKAFWKYGSFYEARKACKEWELKGGSYKVEFEKANDIKNKRWIAVKTNQLRNCEHERESNQILGFQIKGIKKGDYKALGDKASKIKIEIVKRFKY